MASARSLSWAFAIAIPSLSGCVVAAVPVAAGALIGRRQLDRSDGAASPVRAAAQAQHAAASGRLTMLPAGSALPPPDGVPVATPSTPVPTGMQYLYGSGEAAAASIEAWRSLVRHVASTAIVPPADGAVLAADATLAAPRWKTCGDKPRAVVFDIDETVLLNLGFEADGARGAPFAASRWDAWERGSAGRVAAVPGAQVAVQALRTMGITVVFNTNRSTANAEATARTLADAGLGAAVPGETLFTGDPAAPAGKDARRATIASRYCVLAMAGDQLGDFSDLFNAGLSPQARRAAVMAPPIASRWGAGWFMLPNPVYGTALQGGTDDVFPADQPKGQ